MKFLKNLINLLKPKITVLENLNEDTYTFPIYYKTVNDTGKEGWYLANGIVFGDGKIERNKKILLMNSNTEEMRIAEVICGGDFTGPVFDKNETLLTHEILGIEV